MDLTGVDAAIKALNESTIPQIREIAESLMDRISTERAAIIVEIEKTRMMLQMLINKFDGLTIQMRLGGK